MVLSSIWNIENSSTFNAGRISLSTHFKIKKEKEYGWFYILSAFMSRINWNPRFYFLMKLNLA